MKTTLTALKAFAAAGGLVLVINDVDAAGIAFELQPPAATDASPGSREVIRGRADCKWETATAYGQQYKTIHEITAQDLDGLRRMEGVELIGCPCFGEFRWFVAVSW